MEILKKNWKIDIIKIVIIIAIVIAVIAVIVAIVTALERKFLIILL